VRRPQIIALIALAVILFLLVSGLLARVWSADGAESAAVAALIRAEARGDQNGMLAHLRGCRANVACAAHVADLATVLREPGTTTILHFTSSTGFSLSGTVGTARVAWKVPSSLPIVQCVRVHRAGNALRGLHIELLAISPRIKSDSDCPRTF
jgi:hypothetical protein